MSDLIRVLNQKGIALFEDYIDRGAIGAVPEQLLEDDDTSEPLRWDVSIEDREFEDSYEFGSYLAKKLSSCDVQEISYDSGLWSWLALYYFDQLSPADATGKRKPGKSHRYVLMPDNFRHYYRHLVRTPFVLARAHGENSKVLLSKPLNTHGELSEQIMSRQELTGTPSIMSAIHKLYYDEVKMKARPGATTRNRAGVVLRLVDILKQFGATYDLHSLTGEQIVGLLPDEFSKWMQA